MSYAEEFDNLVPTKEATSSSYADEFDKLETSKELSKPAKKEPTGYALPDTTAGRATTGLLGEAKGVFDTIVDAPAQILAKGVADVYPKSWPGYDFFQGQKETARQTQENVNKGFEDVTRNTRTSANIGEGFGNVVGAMAIPQSKAAEGANLFNRMIAAGKTGAKVGSLTSTSAEDKNFWEEKVKSTVFGGIAGFLAQPVVEGAIKSIGYLYQKTDEVAKNIGKNIFGIVTGEMKDKVASEAVEKLMQNASPELKQTIQQEIAKGKNADISALGRQVEADTLPIKMKLTAGQATQNPGAISVEMNTRGKNPAMQFHLQDQNNQLIQNLNHVREIGAPEAAVTDHITAGENLIKAGQNILDTKQEATTALYKKLADANGGNLPMDGKAFVDSAESALKKQMKAPFLPSQVKTILEDIKSSSEPMTFENFENLRTILASASRTAERASDGNASAAIRSVRDALENMPIQSGVKGVKELADAARMSAKEGFEMQRNNPAFKAIADGKAADDKFIQKYIIGASKKDLTNLAEAFKEDPIALQTIKAGTVNYLKNAAGVLSDNGNFSQHGYNKSLQSLGPKLEVIFGPDEAEILKKVGNVSRYIQLSPKGSFVNASNTDVSHFARSGSDMAANAVDRMTGLPIGSATREAVANALHKRANQTMLNQMSGPGAGVFSEGPRSQLPARIGQAAVIPISSLMTRRKSNE